MALTKRQLQVEESLVAGLSYKEIGKKLFITDHTVKFHCRKLYHHYGVRNRTELAAMKLQQESMMHSFMPA